MLRRHRIGGPKAKAWTFQNLLTHTERSAQSVPRTA